MSKESGRFHSEEQSSSQSETKGNDSVGHWRHDLDLPENSSSMVLVNPDLHDFVTLARVTLGCMLSQILAGHSLVFVSMLYSAKYIHVANDISVKAGTHT